MIAGVARLDGAPMASTGHTGADALPRLAARFGSRAPDGTTIWCGEHAGFVHGLLAVTPESEHEAQPLCAGDLTISFDGRLDNRDELIAALDVERERGDAMLALSAYVKWGEAAAGHLLGDFALVVWDAPKRQLYAARDTSGVRPFFYREGPGWIAWASEIDILATGVDAMPPPNEGMVGEHLAGIITSKRDTLFHGISRLPPAHTLTASAAGIHARRYWTPDPRAEIRYRHDADYEAHLADLIRAAVSARLRTRRPVGVMLSGGIDSSSILALGAHACRDSSVPCPGLRAFSISVPGPDDERPFFDLMIAAAGVPAERFNTALPRPGQFREEAARDLEIQAHPHAPTVDPLRARVRDSGARVLLTGMGGDDWLGPSAWAYADMLRGGQLAALGRRIWSESATDDFGGWRFACKAALWPLVPDAAKRAVRRVLGRGRPPGWLDPDFAARIDLSGRLALRSEVDFRYYEQIDLWREGTSGTMVHAIETTSRSGSRFGIEHWHPYLDRRIIEFGLALPHDQRWRDGRAKDLLRRTMAPHVPAAIAGRLTNPTANHVFIQAIAAELPPAGPAPRSASAQLGWVRGAYVQELRTRAQRLYQSGDPAYVGPAWIAWIVLATDLWLDAANVVQ